MDKIIDFDVFKTDHQLYDGEAKEILKDMRPEIRDKVREAVEFSTRSYIEELSKPIHIQISESSTDAQKESISVAIKKHQDLCKQLINDLALSNAKLIINQYKKS